MALEKFEQEQNLDGVEGSQIDISEAIDSEFETKKVGLQAELLDLQEQIGLGEKYPTYTWTQEAQKDLDVPPSPAVMEVIYGGGQQLQETLAA